MLLFDLVTLLENIPDRGKDTTQDLRRCQVGYLAGTEISIDKRYCSRDEYKETNWLNDHKTPYPQVSPGAAAML